MSVAVYHGDVPALGYVLGSKYARRQYVRVRPLAEIEFTLIYLDGLGRQQIYLSYRDGRQTTLVRNTRRYTLDRARFVLVDVSLDAFAWKRVRGS